MQSNTFWIASFDIGKKNFSFYIEEVNYDELMSITVNNISKEKRYNENGSLTKEMNDVMTEVYKTGKTILYNNEDLTKNTKTSAYLDPQLFYNLTDHLDKYLTYFQKCSYFLLEKQMKKNVMALKLCQHCYTYLTLKLDRTNIKIIEFPAYYKTQILGAEKEYDKTYKNGNIKWRSMTQRERKKWSIIKGKSILDIRGELDTMDFSKHKKKLDDIFDNKLMIEAFKYLHFVDLQEF
jgi:hypothetical protein